MPPSKLLGLWYFKNIRTFPEKHRCWSKLLIKLQNTCERFLYRFLWNLYGIVSRCFKITNETLKMKITIHGIIQIVLCTFYRVKRRQAIWVCHIPFTYLFIYLFILYTLKKSKTLINYIPQVMIKLIQERNCLINKF